MSFQPTDPYMMSASSISQEEAPWIPYALQLHFSCPKFASEPLSETDKIITETVLGIINDSTAVDQFKNECSRFPSFKLEYLGSCPFHYGTTALHIALKSKNYEIAKYIISKLDSQYIDARGLGISNSPLFDFLFHDTEKKDKINFSSEELEIVQVLLLAGADPNYQSCSYRLDGFMATPFSLAIEKCNLPLIKLCMVFGAKKISAFTDENKTGLTKQKFEPAAESIYQQAKEQIKKENAQKTIFFLGYQDKNSLIRTLPKEILTLILTWTSPTISSPYPLKLKNIKRSLTELQNGVK